MQVCSKMIVFVYHKIFIWTNSKSYIISTFSWTPFSIFYKTQNTKHNFFFCKEQSPGFPHGDGDCKAPGCDCGTAPCGFYLWNHSSDVVVHGQTFQDWFVQDYMLNKVGMSNLVSGFFWDDFWPAPGERFPDASAGQVANDTGLNVNLAEWKKITNAYHANMDVLRSKTLEVGKFAWQLLWTGGDEKSVGGTVPSPVVVKTQCANILRSLCTVDAPPQTRAMMFALNTPRGQPDKLLSLHQDLTNFLLVRGPFAWLGHAWKGCSKNYPFPKEFAMDYGIPIDMICYETNVPGVFTREWSNANVTMDCNTWTPTISWKQTEIL